MTASVTALSRLLPYLAGVPRDAHRFARARGTARAALVRGVASPSASLGLGVVVVQQVQHPVHDEQRELVVERTPALASPGGCATVGHTTTSPSSVGGSPGSVGAPGPRPPWSGWRPPGGSVVVHREREHVGRAVAAEEALVQLGDRRARRRTAATSRRRSERSATRSSLEHELREPHPARRRRPRRRAARRRRTPTSVGSVTRARRASVLVPLVRVDDVLHDAVAHDVARAELDEREPVDAVEDVAHLRAGPSGRGPRAGRSG